jgi:prepilin peptidase CpaA
MNPQMAIALVLGAAATVTDLRWRQIPNWIPILALVAGFSYNVWGEGWRGLGTAGLGAVCGFGVFLVFYLLGGMGGGDIKLMAGFGSLLGASTLLQAAFWTAIAGGLVAAVALVRRRRAAAGAAAHDPNSIPYAPAIAFGVWIALWGKA